MTEVIFRLNERDLDRMLAEARAELDRRDIVIADGSARDALVWATSFSTERQVGPETHRVATTITLNDEAPLSIQTVAIAPRLTHRIAPEPLPWPELRRRGMAEVVAETLEKAQVELITRIGVDYAYEEFARRCTRMIDIIGDDIPDAELLRDRVRGWREQAEARTLFSRARPFLINEYGFGHVDDDLQSLNEFYESTIFKPLTGTAAPAGKPALHVGPPQPEVEHSRRPALLDRIPQQAQEATSGEPVNAIGIVLLVLAIGVLATGAFLRSWPVLAGGGVFLLLVIRAMWQWRG